MKKFEEEVRKNGGGFFAVHKNGKTTYEIQGLTSSPLIIFRDWVSPEDQQTEIGKIELQNSKYREEIARMQKSLRKKNKAIKELNGAVKNIKSERDEWKAEANKLDKEKDGFITENEQLKSQLEKQQPKIPEVPPFVADWYEENKHRIELATFSINANICVKSSKARCDIEDWFADAENKPIETIFAMKNGYTVAKDKRFYLKNKLTELYLYKAFGGKYGEEYPTGFSESFQFTQQEIDSMETGSYEQIEVGE